MKIASYYEKREHQAVQCGLCPEHCYIKEGETGRCGVRENHKGTLMAMTYGSISSYGLDPIEKKPLFHYYPGKKISSFGSYGCNLKCQFCQNHLISQQIRITEETSVQELIRKSMEDQDSIGIAATYNEPTIQFEYLVDLFSLNRKYRRKNVMVTNGYIEKAPLMELVPLVDAFNVDLKGFTNDFYANICGGRLKPVLDAIEHIYDRSHLELTLLLIPGLNDAPENLKKMFEAIRAISPDIPLHISRYFPNYQMFLPETPLADLKMAVNLAKEHLNYVYLGNVPGISNQTKCKSCEFILIERSYGLVETFFKDEHCPNCGRFHHITFD